MTGTVPLGEFAGVRVRAHWSVTAALGLVAGALAFARWPRVLPAYPDVVLFGAAVVAAVFFVASLMVREVAPALVARRHGAAAPEVTLWFFGGTARKREAPGAELRVAVAGPLASLSAGALLGLAAWGGALLGAPLLAVDALTCLTALNVALALFHLLPAAPLDGGRILRAALAARRGDRARAAVRSARAGQAFGAALMASGAVLLAGPSGGGVWWLLTGVFTAVLATVDQPPADARRPAPD
ncbi:MULTISPECIES: site-2 protease family protein [Amycolatopsis]|uniref:site-2 protease family protein n=1 Tax=Amycolatopsis TaxID=1813 RepID=UPI000B8A8578|nr:MULTISPECIES: site-2 protease family protein [Amycolatopsis]OXM75120.1 hypothetical protein CF166_00555 [Amycolatopsis sp. KNN50.9b]